MFNGEAKDAESNTTIASGLINPKIGEFENIIKFRNSKSDFLYLTITRIQL